MRTDLHLTMVLALILVVGCTRTPTHQVSSAQAPQAQAAPRSAASTASSDPEEDGDGGSPSTEAEMLSQFDALIVPPPVGPNGEARTFYPDSTTANAVTGQVTVSTSTENPDPDTKTQPMFVRTATGLAYELHNVPAGGVNATATLDWSHIMGSDIGMAAFLKDGGDLPETLVFVYRVRTETVARTATNGGLCGPRKTGYVAFTVHSSGSTADHPLAIAAFGEGPWPPKNANSLCGVYQYASRS